MSRGWIGAGLLIAAIWAIHHFATRLRTSRAHREMERCYGEDWNIAASPKAKLRFFGLASFIFLACFVVFTIAGVYIGD